MKAIILAAGRGSRMGGKTADSPKCLVKLCGRTLLDRQVEALKSGGVGEIGIVRGYLAEKINVSGAHYFENKRWNETNMLTSLCCAEEWLGADDCIVSYSDIVYSAEAIRKLSECNENISITCNTRWLKLWKERFEDPLSDAETFKVDSDHYITEIGGRARSLDEIEGQYMGLLKLRKEGWREIKDYLAALGDAGVNRLDMTALLSNLIKRGTKIYAIPYDGIWLEVDNENDLRQYEEGYSQALL